MRMKFCRFIFYNLRRFENKIEGLSEINRLIKIIVIIYLQGFARSFLHLNRFCGTEAYSKNINQSLS